jgi:hypothetical protein
MEASKSSVLVPVMVPDLDGDIIFLSCFSAISVQLIVTCLNRPDVWRTKRLVLQQNAKF